MPHTVLSAGGTKICKADTSHWESRTPVELIVLQEESIGLPKRLLKLKKMVDTNFQNHQDTLFLVTSILLLKIIN